MRLFRIAKARHIEDLSGTGARRNGGRWNHKGTGMVYTSPNRALATVEYLVHVPLAFAPGNLAIALIEVPEDIAIDEVAVSDLPPNWRSYPPPPELPRIGTHWAQSPDRSLLLSVPSAVVEGETNILINPVHTDIRRIRIADIRSYTFDRRSIR